ncbi:MAG TPA: glutamate--tRNA ligase [Candidatus Dormibacteraeota bacterium]|nr:glutamate--tRNA ligase [Candidatus Dormibacteraeota bacterium]
MSVVRTRFAPSPTGFLHLGGLRTALFGWLVARQAGGQFILRLEDTDLKREVPEAAEQLMNSLKALGLNYDEGPDIGGPFGPYRQSERLRSYQKWAQKLIDSGRAYADPYSAEQLQTMRLQAQKDKRPFLYRDHRPQNPPPWSPKLALRFKSEPQSYTWQDAVMGQLKTGPEVIDDFILIKSDGYPTYNFAHIIDDFEMQISHVIRGQEFLASVPNYLNLYQALAIKRPILATVPHILNPEGNKKLSKRAGDGQAAKDIFDYLKTGYLEDALFNFIACLGWNDGTEQEIFTRAELIKKFSLDDVQKSGARFDESRLLWMNGHYIRNLTADELYQNTEDYWPKEASTANEAYKKQVLSLVQERMKYFAELPELTKFFFTDLAPNPGLISGHKQLSRLTPAELRGLLEKATAALAKSDFSQEKITQTLNKLLTDTGQKPSVLFSLIRIATTQAPASPELAGSLSVLGKETALRRLNQQLTLVSD